MQKKQKTLYYKYAEITGTSITLQDALQGVLKNIPLPENRLEKLGTDKDEGQVLLDPRHQKSVLFLTMGSFVEGTLQPIMGIAKAQSTWPIRQVAPPALPGGIPSEFLEGYLFMGVWKNHVIILPTRSCSSEQLELHLRYLLRKYSLWPEKANVSLNDRSPQDLRNKKFKKVKAFKFEAPLETKLLPPKDIDEDSDNPSGLYKFIPKGATWEGIKNFIAQIGGKLPDDVFLEDAISPEDLQVKLEIICRKKALDRSGPLLDILANSLRHVTTDVVEIEFEDGSKIRGSDLKTMRHIRIECSGNLPIPTQVDNHIFDYLQDLIKQGTVS